VGIGRIGRVALGVAAWVSAAGGAAARAGEAPSLKVGDPAPALHVSKWINGEPVETFEKGTVYVIECWATWCGPCRASIPHVSDLQAKMKDRKVVVIGLNVWERDTSRVEPFVKQMGEKMNYRVALDAVGAGGKGKSAAAWLEAAGQDGIPCAFIVDRETRIAWIGHPMSMDKVLEEVAAGTFDAAKHAAAAAERKALEQRLAEAAQKRDPDAILEVLDAMEAKDPALAVQLSLIRFEVLFKMKKDLDAAYAHARKMSATLWKEDGMALNNVAWVILDTPDVARRDLDLALEMAVAANRLTKSENAAVMDTLARAHFEKGAVGKAIEIVEAALKKTDNEELTKHLTASLARYRERQRQAK